MPTDVCSPNSSGQKPKPQPLPQPDAKSRGVKHAAVYGDARPQGPSNPAARTAVHPSDIVLESLMATTAPAEPASRSRSSRASTRPAFYSPDPLGGFF
jgi:hypothetical protein